MNIDQFREEQARINQELEAENVAQVEQGTATTVEEVVQETEQADTVPVQVGAENETPTAQIETPETTLDAQRLADELARAQQALKQAQEAKLWFDKINENPDYAKAFAEDNGLQYIDPKDRAVQELERRYQDMLLEKEINLLQTKYEDFDPQTVVQTAINKGINNLEDAYLLSKVAQPVEQKLDVDAIREQIRQDILNELQSNVSTTSMIGAGGSGSRQVEPASIELSPTELKVVQGMGLTPAEYQKWKQAK